MHRYRAGERWWLHEDELVAAASVEQQDRYDGDGWEPIVMRFVNERSADTVTLATILTDPNALDIRKGDITKRSVMRVAAILRSNGWTKSRELRNGVRERIYHRPR